MKSLSPWSLLLLSLSLVAGCGGSSSDDDEEPEPQLEVLTVSGVTVNLSGRSFVTACETIGSGSPEDVRKGLVFDGTRGVWQNASYTSDDGSCSESSSIDGTYTSEFTAPSTIAINGWVTAGGGAATAPQAADESGPLRDDEPVTLLQEEVISSSGSGMPPKGTTGYAFFVVDDTEFQDSGCLKLYLNENTQYAIAENAYTNGSCDP